MKTNNVDVLIVGAGLSGLSVARFLKNEHLDISLMVLEKSERPGGAILSHSEEGYLAEWGAHGFLDNCEESKTLIGLAGLEEEVEKASLGKFSRYICLNGKLNIIPQQPRRILLSNLVSPWAKLRVLADLWKKPLAGEPTVAEWVAHRFGRSILPFADAVFTGTYAGDIDRLKMDAVMPGIRRLELQHGSLVRGLMHKRKERNRGAGGGEKLLTMPAMTSFRGGMACFTQALAAGLRLNDELYYRTEVTQVGKTAEGWEVTTSLHKIQCRNLILALPVNHSLSLLGQVKEIGPPPMSSIPEARIATIAMGFTDKAQVPFGFGYLAPESEKRFALGTLFSSHMFPGRAPRGHVLLETLVGGRRHPERLDLDDETIINRVYEDLSKLLVLPEKPCFVHVMRPRAGIPQLEAGYPSLLSWLDKVHGDNGDLHICGFGWHGIGINDMTKEAKKVADGVLLATRPAKEASEVKGVYF